MTKKLFTSTTNGLELWVDVRALEGLRRERENRLNARRERGGKSLCGEVPRSVEEAVQLMIDRVKVNLNCWESTGGKSTSGYAMDWFINRTRILSRVVFFLVHNPSIMPVMVCHHCDNRICLNPDHLFAGNGKINCDDKIQKGRAGYVMGRQISNAKLDEEKVLEIRRNAALGVPTTRALATKYGIGYFALRDVIVERTWKHVRPDPNPARK